MNQQPEVINQPLPSNFLWGASTASHQVEGGLHDNWTVWEEENADSLAAKAESRHAATPIWEDVAEEAKQPDNYISGAGVDHFGRYREDFDIVSSLGLNCFRFGIDWSRIEPAEGEWNQEAIGHYRTYLSELKDRNITPMATLVHFTLPVWFAEKGGFERSENIKYFVRYADKVLEELGDNLSWIITINEPTVVLGEGYMTKNWPAQHQTVLTGLKVLKNEIEAHRQVYELTRKNSAWKVSMAHHLTNYFPADKSLLSALVAKLVSYGSNWFTLNKVKDHSDFMAVNHYFTHWISGFVTKSRTDKQSDLGWPLQPEYLEDILFETWESYGLPVIVSENGLADSKDSNRAWWIDQSVAAVKRARSRGADIFGYLHWSLLDNFEWDKGYWPKFGLVEVDRTTMERHLRPSAEHYGDLVKAERRKSQQ